MPLSSSAVPQASDSNSAISMKSRFCIFLTTFAGTDHAWAGRGLASGGVGECLGARVGGIGGCCAVGGLLLDWNTGRPARAAGGGGAPKPVQRGGGEGV